MSLIARIEASIVCAILLLGVRVHAQNEEAESFLAGAAENSLTWRQFDCLVYFEYVDEVPERHAKVLQGYQRILCDYDNNRFCFIQKRNREVEDFASKSHQRSSETKALISINSETSWRVFPHNINRRKVDDLETILSSLEFIDLRRLNLDYCFPMTFDDSDSGRYESRVTAMKSARVTGKIIDDLQRVLLSTKYSRNGSLGTQSNSYVFDKKTMQPIEWMRTDERSSGQDWQYKQSVEWQDVGGTIVPQLISASIPIPIPGAVNNQRFYDAQVSYRIHWFSVNEPIVEDRFRVDSTTDLNVALEMLDPKATGAESLADETEGKRKSQ